jgi:uncharacterized membrane protein (UPF0127 family)
MRQIFTQKSSLFISLAVIVLLGIFLWPALKTSTHKSVSYDGFKTTSYELEGKNLKFLVAETPAQWEKGLMYYRKLEGVSGMIFKFPDSSVRTFWNKNTFMDLKVYWINEGKVLGVSDLPSIEKSKRVVYISSPANADTVIELVQ